MKKLLSLFTLLALLFSLAPCAAAETSAIKYAAVDEKYTYSSVLVWLAADKSTGEIIPLSKAGDDGYIYAYLPLDGEIELCKVAPGSFSDIEYSNLYINELSARGIISGFEDGTFRPDSPVTRAEAAVMIAKLLSLEPSDAPSVFADVESSAWYCGYLTALVEAGVISEAENFNPLSPATREEIMTMLCRTLTALDCPARSEEYDLSAYLDCDDVAEYAKSAYAALLSGGYMVFSDIIDNDFMDTSDDEFYLYPKQSVTRYEFVGELYYFIRDFFSANAPAIKRADAPDVEIPILDGSTSTYDITSNIYWKYYINSSNHPDLPAAHSKTSNSYKRLIDGEVEMIFVPDPSEDIVNYAEEQGVELEYIPIATEALVFFTASDNPAESVTTQNLYDIYVNNSIQNWSEIGGSDAALVPFCRNNDSGSHAQMEKFILNGGEINDQISLEHTSWVMSTILTEVDDYNYENEGEYALGYSLYYYYQNAVIFLGTETLKLLSIDGIAPSDESIATGQYPYTTNYYAVIRSDASDSVREFAALMQSDFGKEIISMSGLGTIAAE